jgi:hypothetical protein
MKTAWQQELAGDALKTGMMPPFEEIHGPVLDCFDLREGQHLRAAPAMTWVGSSR